MKKFSLSFLVALIAMVTLFMTSCERSEIIEETPVVEETLRFAKDLIITDESGQNTVTLLVESDNEAILADYDEDMYKLVAFFETPSFRTSVNNPANDLGQQETPDDFTIGALLSVKSTSLQDGVVFYQLVKEGFERENSRACSLNYATVKSQKDRVDIDVNSGTTGKVKVYRKNGILWTRILNVCASSGDTYNNIGWTGSPQIKVKISQVLGYTLSFHN